MKRIFPLIVFSLLLCLPACDKQDMPTITGSTMGTSYTIKVPQLPFRLKQEELAKEVDLLLGSVNNSMSTYLPNSEVSRFNAMPVGEWVIASAGFYNVLRFGKDLCEYTDGAFDPTVGPLVNAWGFGPGNVSLNVPDAALLEGLMQQLGCDGIELFEEKRKVSKNRDIKIDLSAIAKGYAVDIISNYMILMKVRSYMVEIGGEVFVRGYKSRYDRWKIAVECPDEVSRLICKILEVRNIGIATSGDYRNYFEKEGKRYSHTLDPSTGYPVEHTLASVTVLHPSVMQADGFATAIMVMGPEKGYDFAMKNELPALFLVRDGKGFDMKYTPFLERYLEKEEE